jgi:hypothetical protein
LSEPALVGLINADGTFTARYLHWAGIPTETVAGLRTIWADHFGRDTTALTAALLDRDWDRLCPACRHRQTKAIPVAVPGVGHALAAAQPPVQGSIATAERHGYTEWMYLIDDEAWTVRVYEATVHDRWLLHSLHPLDPGTAPALPYGPFRRGDRVVLEHTTDPESQLRPGDQGTVVGDQTVNIRWDSGATWAMPIGDRIRLLAPDPDTLTPRQEENR